MRTFNTRTLFDKINTELGWIISHRLVILDDVEHARRGFLTRKQAPIHAGFDEKRKEKARQARRCTRNRLRDCRAVCDRSDDRLVGGARLSRHDESRACPPGRYSAAVHLCGAGYDGWNLLQDRPTAGAIPALRCY